MAPFIVLFGISTCLKGWILWLGKSRKLLSEFRWFFIYIVYSFLASIARFAVLNNRKFYYYVYWSTEALALLLLVRAVGESFARTLRPFTLLKGVRIAFWICVIAPVLYAISRSLIEPPAEVDRSVRAIIGIEITLQYLVTAMMLLYMALVRIFNIRDHRYETGIILGFGINASLSAVGYLLRSIFGTRLVWLSSGLPPLAFVIAEWAWVVALRRSPAPPEEAPAIPLSPDEIIRLLDEQLNMLLRLLGKRWSRPKGSRASSV